MAVEYDVNDLRVTSNGSKTIYPAGMTGQPKAAVVVCSDYRIDGSIKSRGAFSVGVWDGVDQATIGTNMTDNVAAAGIANTTFSWKGYAATVFNYSNPSSVPYFSNITSATGSPAAINFNTNGYWGQNVDISFMSFADVDAKLLLVNAPTSSQTTNHALSFTPKAVICFACHGTPNWANAMWDNSSSAMLSMGASDGINGYCNVYGAFKSPAEKNFKYQKTVLGSVADNVGTIADTEVDASFTTNQIDLTWTINGAGSHRFMFLVLGGDFTALTETLAVPTDSNTKVFSVPGVDPKVYLMGTDMTNNGHTGTVTNDEAAALLEASRGNLGHGNSHWSQRLEATEAGAGVTNVETYVSDYQMFHISRGFSVKVRASSSTFSENQFEVGSWQVIDATQETDYWMLLMGDLGSTYGGNGWTNVGRLRLLQRVHDGTALPAQYNLHLCTDEDFPTPETVNLSELTEIATGFGYTANGYPRTLTVGDALATGGVNYG